MKAFRLLALIGSLLTPVAQLAGQAVAARAVIAIPRSSVSLNGAPERTQGVWGGAALDLRLGNFTVTGSGVRGQLTPLNGTAALQQDAGQLAVQGRYQLRPWLGIALGYTARAFSSPAGRQRWDLWGARATLSRSLGGPDVRADASLVVLPVVDVTGQPGATYGWGSEVGVSAAPERVPVVLRVEYRIERFTFPRISDRSEQFEALTLSVGVRVRRADGHWRIGG